jgi:hypothetical protein
MIGIEQARKLARFREGERRGAAAFMSAAVAEVASARARGDRLGELANAVAAGSGEIKGNALAATGECVARLLAGQIATTHQHDRQIVEVERAQKLFGIADARASVASQNLAIAERLEFNAAEQRAALKTPFRGLGK